MYFRINSESVELVEPDDVTSFHAVRPAGLGHGELAEIVRRKDLGEILPDGAHLMVPLETVRRMAAGPGRPGLGAELRLDDRLRRAQGLAERRRHAGTCAPGDGADLTLAAGRSQPSRKDTQHARSGLQRSSRHRDHGRADPEGRGRSGPGPGRLQRDLRHGPARVLRRPDLHPHRAAPAHRAVAAGGDGPRVLRDRGRGGARGEGPGRGRPGRRSSRSTGAGSAYRAGPAGTTSAPASASTACPPTAGWPS